ncbi:hypothetical protein ACIOZM_13770 [Pseudomonas sp. NPDC087346]|uniref:hypothetical protein n=1 Tax=Pseudomonas sp. NPDC087346 TaxID=3364438 RepID=UPI00381DBA13
MDFSFSMFGAVGRLNGTLTRDQVRSLLGNDFRDFTKTTFSLNTTDAFRLHDLHVFYDERDIVKGVEFFERSTVSWQEHKLVGEKLSTLLDLFRRNGEHPDLNEDGFDVAKFGMRFYVPDLDDGEDALITTLYIVLRSES